MNFSIKDIFLNLISSKRRRLPWDFNSSFYQNLYPDIKNFGLNPRKHYRIHGKTEGRLYKKSTFIKKEPLNNNLETIIFCCDDEQANLFFLETIKKITSNYNIIIVSNLDVLHKAYLDHCNWFILDKGYDRQNQHAKNFINTISIIPNLKFVISNIYEGGFFYKNLEKANIASVLIIDDHLAFGQSNLSRALLSLTRVIYTNENYAKKIPYDFMFGYPDKITTLQAAAYCIPFCDKDITTKTVIGYGNISFADGFDLFTSTANQYKQQYPHSNTEFVWIKAPNKDNHLNHFEENQNWLQVERGDNNVKIASKKNQIKDYYKKTAVFFDTSRFANKISHIKYALMAGKAVFALKDTQPLSSLYQQYAIEDSYLFVDNAPDKFIKHLHEHLTNCSAINKSQLIQIGKKIGNIDEFAKEILLVGHQAAAQIQQEQDDARTLLKQKEFDYKFWAGNNLKPFSLFSAKQYIRSWKSGVFPRRPCAGFHPGIYAEHNNLDETHQDPFLHYLHSNKPKGPWCWDILTKTTAIDEAALNQKIALQIHCYYIEKLEGIITALLSNKVRPDLFISVKDEEGQKLAQNLLKGYPAKVEIFISPNRGRDIGPLLTLFRDQLCDDYEIIGHLHGKYSDHIKNRSYADLWGQYLITNLLGDGKKLNAADTIIQQLYHDKNINLIFPDDKNAISWAKNRPAAQKLAPHLGIKTLPNYINFPVGTMFWARRDLLKPFFDLNLQWDDYLSEPLPLDGTNLHAIERLLGVIDQNISKRLICTMFGTIKR